MLRLASLQLDLLKKEVRGRKEEGLILIGKKMNKCQHSNNHFIRLIINLKYLLSNRYLNSIPNNVYPLNQSVIKVMPF